MEKMLEKFETICYDSGNMSGLLAVLSRGASAEQNFGEEYRDKFYLEMQEALELASQFQRQTADKCWELHDDIMAHLKELKGEEES